MGSVLLFFFFFLWISYRLKRIFFFRSRDYLLRSIMIILWHGCCEIIARVTRFWSNVLSIDWYLLVKTWDFIESFLPPPPPPPPPSHQNLETRILNEGRELIEESNPKITISIMLSSKEDGIQVLPISCSSSILKKRNEKDDKLMKRYNLPLNYLSLQKWTEWKSESCHECDQALNWFFRSKCCACTNEKNK